MFHFNLFPEIVRRKILSFLPLKDKFRGCHVSTEWKEILEELLKSQKKLWLKRCYVELDYGCHEKEHQVSDNDSIQMKLLTCQSVLTIISKCPQLTVVKIDETDSVEKFLQTFSDCPLECFSAKLGTLGNEPISPFTSLRHIQVMASLINVFDSPSIFPKLESLDTEYLPPVQNLSTLRTGIKRIMTTNNHWLGHRIDWELFTSLSTSAAAETIESIGTVNIFSDGPVDIPFFPRLKSIGLFGRGTRREVVNRISLILSKHSETLQELILNVQIRRSNGAWKQILSSLANLKSLSFKGFNCTLSKFINIFQELLPQLEYLHLRLKPSKPNEDFSKLVTHQKFPKLKTLVLSLGQPYESNGQREIIEQVDQVVEDMMIQGNLETLIFISDFSHPEKYDFVLMDSQILIINSLPRVIEVTAMSSMQDLVDENSLKSGVRYRALFFKKKP